MTDLLIVTLLGFIIFVLVEQPLGSIPKLLLESNQKKEKNDDNNNVEMGIKITKRDIENNNNYKNN